MAAQTKTNSFPIRGLLLCGLIVVYYAWLFLGKEESGEDSLSLTDKLPQEKSSRDHFGSGARGSKLQVHPFDGPRAREIKNQLHGKPSEVSNAEGRSRGIMPIRTWADDQVLFQTTIQSERHFQRMWARQGYSGTTLGGKIAFIFLVERDLSLEPVWANFLKGNEHRYNLYVHMNPFQPSHTNPEGVFSGRTVPNMVVERNTPGYVAAVRRLLAHAIVQDPSNEWFTLVSDACLPLHSFDHIYKTFQSTNQSFVEIEKKKSPLLWYRYVARGVHSLEPEISWADFKVGSRWWTMRRKHALMMVDDTKYWNKFKLPCRPEHKLCYPEDHYFSTVLSILDKSGSTGKGVTFQNGRISFMSETPKVFLCRQINATFFSNMQTKDNGQWLFAERFSPACLKTLWKVTRKVYAPQSTEIEGST